MATLNSLLFLFSTLAPNIEPPGNLPVTPVPPEWLESSVGQYVDPDVIPPRFVIPPPYRKNVPVLKQTACHLGEHPSCQYHCQKNCSNYGHDIPCPDICVFGCVCIDPFIRATDGRCIMPYECPAISDTTVTTETTDESDDIECQPDEEVSQYAHCQRNCTNVGAMIVCPGEGPRGCMCRTPKIRGPDGSCIMSEECPPIQQKPQVPILSQLACHLGEHPSCASHCQKNCANYDQNIPCLPICVFGCTCIEPLIRGPDGSCIMPDQCPVTLDTPVTTDTAEELDDIQCQPDEEVSSFAHCQQNCTNVDQLIICPGEGPRGCVCRPPKIRGPDGSCIMSDECPSSQQIPQDADDVRKMTCPANEEVNCFSHCQRNCTNYHKKFHCPMYCVTGCVCTPPLIRGPDGSCIMPEQCNELMAPQKVRDTPCRDSEECDDSDEIDKENEINLRAISGPFDNFKFCEDENEVYKVCSSQCPDNCENYNDTRRACKLICLPLPKCECKDGFVRGPNRNCIPPEQCPQREISSEVCPENEEYKECGTACQKNCRDYDRDIPCEFKCESGCFCKEPMVRGPSGKCIRIEECPARSNVHMQPAKSSNMGFLPDFPRFSCGEYEIFSVCASFCPDDCTNYKEDRLCKKICVPACKCIEGYVKGKDGKCIKKEECEEVVTEEHNVCSEFEDFDECGSHCERDCYNYDAPKRRCKDRSCNPGCFCKTGLVRSPDGRCITAEECPADEEPSWSTSFLKLRGQQLVRGQRLVRGRRS